MRLPVEGYARLGTLALALGLTGCGLVGGGDKVASAAQPALALANGPSADYPMVLGEPYSIDGVEYVPADVMNYDEVGYASGNAEGGITAAHRTLPLPSYIEVTSLETGKTILVRVERRGPMTGPWLVGLSAGAQAQLGAGEGTPVRVRRVNPPEAERALLRAGQTAPERLETPMSLVAVLKRKLPEAGPISLATAPVEVAEYNMAEAASEAPAALAEANLPQSQEETPAPVAAETPEPQLALEAPADSASEPQIAAMAPVVQPEPPIKGMVVQAATFSVEANARRAAEKLDGFVIPAGKFFRVRTGPYSTRGQADAALAKVKAAGYSDARVIDAG